MMVNATWNPQSTTVIVKGGANVGAIVGAIISVITAITTGTILYFRYKQLYCFKVKVFTLPTVVVKNPTGLI